MQADVGGATEPAMPTEPKKPLIVISYAHADEPERPAEGKVKWLSFVTGYLRPAVQQSEVDSNRWPRSVGRIAQLD